MVIRGDLRTYKGLNLYCITQAVSRINYLVGSNYRLDDNSEKIECVTDINKHDSVIIAMNRANNKFVAINATEFNQLAEKVA